MAPGNGKYIRVASLSLPFISPCLHAAELFKRAYIRQHYLVMIMEHNYVNFFFVHGPSSCRVGAHRNKLLSYLGRATQMSRGRGGGSTLIRPLRDGRLRQQSGSATRGHMPLTHPLGIPLVQTFQQRFRSVDLQFSIRPLRGSCKVL